MARRTEDRRPRKALVVEDEFLVSLHVADALEECGFEVVGPAGRLADALRLAHVEANVAVAVLDVNLAGELSWPVARVLRQRQIPFLFVTGYIEAHARPPEDLRDAPILAKPVVGPELCDAIDRVLSTGWNSP